MKNQLLTLFALLVFALGGCKDVATINADEAGKVIVAYLKANPEYHSTKFNFGEIKFNTRNEMLLLEKYRALAEEGYISMELEQGKKKFLSKDSSFVYLVKLSDKASDLVLKLDGNQANVKAVVYELSSEQPVDFNRVNDNAAKVTVSLKKVNTVFAPFQKGKNQNSDFITKTYRLKLNKEEGWKVVK